MKKQALYIVICIMFVGMCAMGIVIRQQQNYIESLHNEVASNSIDIYALKNEPKPEDNFIDIARLSFMISDLQSRIDIIEDDVRYNSSQTNMYPMPGSSIYDLESRINDLERQVSNIKQKIGLYY